ncbi:MAG: LysM peptidoglycan-binding domain-containing protein [Anaerolineales bacterium]
MKKLLLVLVGVMLSVGTWATPVFADTTYVVQPGDNLARIAQRFGVNYAALVAANQITNPNLIQIGQTLVIPGVGGAAGPATGGATYVVQRGDNLARIAQRFGVPYAALLTANQITNPNLIQIGQTLVIPGVAQSAPAPSAPAASAPAAGAGVNHLGTEKVVLADYVMWYNPEVFDGSKTWDVPRDGAYNSDDFGTIQRHVAQAGQACVNGFAAHWYGPQEGRTTNNFGQLLSASGGTGLRHAVVIQTNVLPGATEQMLIDAVNHVLANWAQHENYLRLGGRPVLIFTDMPRPWGSEAAAKEGWARVRAATDPQHNSIWMAEGLTTAYNPLFDGLYAYRIDHRDFPRSWLKQPRWAGNLRAVERRGNLPLGGLYFADTISPGFDDTRAANAGSDLRAPSPAFARDRRSGGYYADTFAATAQTGGDFLLVKSFNEWIEGTQVEPGSTYGDLYLNLTCQYANAYRGR